MTTPGVGIGSMLAGYRIDGLIGRGGMGVVYIADQPGLDRQVAIKVIAPELANNEEFRRRFQRESRIAASIEHPNAIPIHEAGEENGTFFLVMRYIEGVELRRLILNEGRLEPLRAARIISQVAGALDEAHARGLVHRDVKSGNILITSKRGHDHAYLTDFGLTKRTTSQTGITATGNWVGTLDYAAPEQIEGKPVDARADVYSLGCLIFETLTGRVPFQKDSDLAKLFAHVNEPPAPPTSIVSELPKEIDAVVARAMAKDPDARYPSAGDLARAMTAALEGRTVVEPERSVASGAAAATSGGVPTEAGASLAGGPESEVGEEVPGEPSVPAGPTMIRGGPAATPTTAAGTAGGGGAPGGTDGGERPTAPRESAEPPSRPHPRRRLLLAGLAAVIAVGAVGALIVGGGDDDDAGVTSGQAVADGTGTVQWRTVADAPSARQQTAGGVFAGKIWLIGGLAGAQAATATASVETYDPVTDTWGTGPELPFPLHHAVVRNYDGELVVIGGWIPKGADLTARESDQVLALRDGAWVPLPSLNHARAAASAAVVGDKLVVIGGQADGELVPTTEVFDGESWSEAAEIPTPREHLAAASDGEFVYTVGGRELSSDANSGALERYDPSTDSWAELPDMPTPVGSFDAAIRSGRLITVGGEMPTQVSDLVQAYNIKSEQWSELPSLPTPRHGITVVALGGLLYALVGAEAPSHSESTAASTVLDLGAAFGETPASGRAPKVGDWRQLSSAPTARQQAASAAHDGRGWLIGGLAGDDATKVVSTSEAYDPAIDTWTSGPDLPEAVHHATAASYDGELVVVGGWIPEGTDLTANTSGRVYALRDGEWVALPELNHPRAAAAAAVVGDKLVVAGGQADGELVTTTEVFDGESWTEAAEIPTPREHLAAASDGEFVYAVGGRDLSSDANSAALERYDPDADEWVGLADMPVASGSMGAAIIGSALVVVGGDTPTSASNDVQAYDLSADSWSKLTPLPTPRHGLGVLAIGRTLYALAGALSAGHADSSASAEALDFDD